MTGADILPYLTGELAATIYSHAAGRLTLI